ncbi:MAG TPA: hypothetical protein VD794_04680 [Flavisolibacter sp.]|nr:hypothetical protein [Flavisolibacter sp.]
MAKQVGPLFITGTIDGIIFYKLGDQYYLRSKGAYKSGKQMRKDPTFKRTLEKAAQFGLASKLVRWVYYRHLPRTARKHGLFGQLTGLANRLLQQGKSQDAVQAALIAHCTSLLPVKPPQSAAIDKTTIPKNRSTINDQRSTLNHQPTPPKHPRYLSRWKVKPNGRLQLPKRNTLHCAWSSPNGSS